MKTAYSKIYVLSILSGAVFLEKEINVAFSNFEQHKQISIYFHCTRAATEHLANKTSTT